MSSPEDYPPPLLASWIRALQQAKLAVHMDGDPFLVGIALISRMWLAAAPNPKGKKV